MEDKNNCQCDKRQVVTIDVTNLADVKAIYAQILKFAQPDLSIQIELCGKIEFYLCLDALSKHCRDSFHCFVLSDHSQLLSSNYVKNMAQENTVRGIFTRNLMALAMATTDERQLQVYELALRELLARFANMGGDCV